MPHDIPAAAGETAAAIAMPVAIATAVARHFETAARLSQTLAANPELSGAEYASSAAIVAILKDAGYEMTYPFLDIPTAFRGILKNGAGPGAAFLVEYDALPEIGHGCGHNLHGALSVLAALAITELRALFKGEIHVIGTPAEERDGAKAAMADVGIFDDLILASMMHCVGGGVCQGNMAALGLRQYNATFEGRAAHAVAAPWEGASALAAARKFLDLVDARRECFTPDIRFNAVFSEGGDAPNIIPARAVVRLDFRADTVEKLDRMDAIVKHCAEGAALALDCHVTFSSSGADYAPMKRETRLEETAARLLEKRGFRVGPVTPALGSSDMGNVSQRCPALQPLLAITGEVIPWHTKDFAAACLTPQAEDAMRRGAETLVELTLLEMAPTTTHQNARLSGLD